MPLTTLSSNGSLAGRNRPNIWLRTNVNFAEVQSNSSTNKIGSLFVELGASINYRTVCNIDKRINSYKQEITITLSTINLVLTIYKCYSFKYYQVNTNLYNFHLQYQIMLSHIHTWGRLLEIMGFCISKTWSVIEHDLNKF